MSREEARRAAIRSFGSVDQVKDGVRDAWLVRMVETILQDVRYGARTLRKNPGFTLVIVFTMALGIGANTAIFSVVNGVLLKPLPYKRGDELVIVRQPQTRADVQDIGFSPKEMDDYRAQASTLAGLVEFHSMWFILLGRPEPERVQTGVVSANFFDVLGVKPILGRRFRSEDEKHGAPAVLVLSYPVLAAQLRRRREHRRTDVPHERPAAHGRRRPAADPAVSARRWTSTCRRRRARSDPIRARSRIASSG